LVEWIFAFETRRIAFDLAVDLDLVYAPIAKSFAAGGRWQRWYSRNLRGIAALHIFKQS
jgi:hypothetical protein